MRVGQLRERVANLEQLFRILALDAWNEHQAEIFDRLAESLARLSGALAKVDADDSQPVSDLAPEGVRIEPLSGAVAALRATYGELGPQLQEAEVVTGHADHELVADLLDRLDSLTGAQ